MSLKFRLKVLSFISFIIIGIDQLTKRWAYNELKFQSPIYYLSGLIKIIYAENRGAWGSMGSELDPVFHFFLLILIPCIALGAFSVYTLRNKKLTSLELYAYAFIISGGLGNIIDRILYGYVIDFLYIGYKSIGTNIFNIADVAIMFGVGVLVWQYFQQKLAEKNSTQES